MKNRLFFSLLIAILFSSVNLSETAEAVCESERLARESAWNTLEVRIAAHMLAQTALNLAATETYRTGKSPSAEKWAALVLAEETARALRNSAQAAYDQAEEAVVMCHRLHRHSCGCPSTTHGVTSCSCSWRSYRYGVACPCYESSS